MFRYVALVIAAIAALLPQVMAGPAVVRNHCSFPVYLKQGAMMRKLAPETGSYTMTQGGSGRAILLARSPSFASPLTFEYTVNGNQVFYDLSNSAGNPFSDFRNTLIPSSAACGRFNCGPNQASCYSNAGDIDVKTCSSSATLTTTLCA